MDSILTSIKKPLGVSIDDDQFDTDIIMHINTALMTLTQLGVGPSEGFEITDDSETWDDLLSGGPDIKLNAVITYVYLKVKLLFDPWLSATVIDAMERQVKELEWRIREAVESAT